MLLMLLAIWRVQYLYRRLAFLEAHTSEYRLMDKGITSFTSSTRRINTMVDHTCAHSPYGKGTDSTRWPSVYD